MEELAGIICNGATCLFGCAKKQVAYVYELEENRESLQGKWDRLRCCYEDVQRRIEEAERMGEMRRTSEVNGWLQKVQNLQKEMMIIPNSQDIHNNKCLCGCCSKSCMSSYKLGKKVVKMLQNVGELLTTGEHFGGVNIAFKLPPKPVDEMASVESKGLDLMFNKVWDSLQDKHVGIIGLHGMGGVGKTTLLKKIHNEFGKRGHNFDVVLWVVVSKDCDINKIMNDIGNRLRVIDDNWNKSSQEQRATKIYQVLKQKKFVLMLDDLWGKLELEMLGVPFSRDTKDQSKVILTTRFEDVCDKMQAQKQHKVECLLEHEAFDLFCEKVGEKTLKYHGEIPKLAREIVNECKGLPLALITIGSAMAGVNSIEAWRQAKNDLRSSPWIALDFEKKVFRILKFSYDRLPDEIHKKCFLYCALYPEDYEIRVDELIDRWIGEGFLGNNKSKSIYDIYEEGESIIAKLKLSCMLEKVDDEWQPSIKMHDVIRDMALWLSRDEDENKDKIIVEGGVLSMSHMNFEKLDIVERISTINGNGSWKVPTCPKLFTLCVQGELKIADFSNLQYMTRLIVLDLSRLRNFNIPREIGNLINLEFLNLSYTQIRESLPIEFKNLKNLRVLLMEYVDCSIEVIPLEVIESLERLKVFRFDFPPFGYYNKRTGVEAFLEKLESLPELEELCFQLKTFTGLQKLLGSNKLRNCSRRVKLAEIKEPLEMTSLLASFSTMKHLDHLSLIELRGIMEGASIADTCHLAKLRRVNIGYCNSITHLSWLKYAPLIEHLQVTNCHSIEEVVKGTQDDDINRENANDLFSNLKSVILHFLPKLKRIHKRALAFPLLNYITVLECPNLRKLPLNSNSAKDTFIKIKGEAHWWNDLEWEDTTTKDRLQSKFGRAWYSTFATHSTLADQKLLTR